MSELKPCPFCGGRAKLHGITFVWVRCDECGAETQGSRHMEYAERNWNRRVGDDLMERMVDDGR